MKPNPVDIIKYSGEQVKFSEKKLRHSLKKTGADPDTIEQVIRTVTDELYPGITTKEIYNRAYGLLKKEKRHLASRYKLKKAIYELGPSGFPFEQFISAILSASGYNTQTNQILQGACVDHEIDVLAQKNNHTTIIECKFHGEQGLKCNVKIPLYIQARYQDIQSHWDKHPHNTRNLTEGWVVTNTKFTEDAQRYGHCAGLYLLSWDHPKGHSLKDRIDRLGLYPITVSSLLTNREKQFLLDRNLVLCRTLKEHAFYLDHLGVSETRQQRIFQEIDSLCQNQS